MQTQKHGRCEFSTVDWKKEGNMRLGSFPPWLDLTMAWEFEIAERAGGKIQVCLAKMGKESSFHSSN